MLPQTLKTKPPEEFYNVCVRPPAFCGVLVSKTNPNLPYERYLEYDSLISIMLESARPPKAPTKHDTVTPKPQTLIPKPLTLLNPKP